MNLLMIFKSILEFQLEQQKYTCSLSNFKDNSQVIQMLQFKTQGKQDIRYMEQLKELKFNYLLLENLYL